MYDAQGQNDLSEIVSAYVAGILPMQEDTLELYDIDKDGYMTVGDVLKAAQMTEYETNPSSELESAIYANVGVPMEQRRPQATYINTNTDTDTDIILFAVIILAIVLIMR